MNKRLTENQQLEMNARSQGMLIYVLLIFMHGIWYQNFEHPHWKFNLSLLILMYIAFRAWTGYRVEILILSYAIFIFETPLHKTWEITDYLLTSSLILLSVLDFFWKQRRLFVLKFRWQNKTKKQPA